MIRSSSIVRNGLVRALSKSEFLPVLSAIAERSYGTFRPKRRSNKNYRPVKAGGKKLHDPAPGNDNKFVDLRRGAGVDDLDDDFGPLGANFIRQIQHERNLKFKHKLTEAELMEEHLRMLDYYAAETGTTEDIVGERRGLAIDMETPEQRQEFLDHLENMISEGRLRDMDLDPETLAKEYNEGKERESKKENVDIDDSENKDPDTYLDPNQLAHGDWSEMLVQVDRNVKLWRGGRLESYRALVIGGNLNGCGGFGTGKSTDPLEAVAKASRVCKRNIFFVDRYQNDGLTRDLVGKQNNCKVVIRATDNGLRGNELVREILKRFGIVNAQAKAYGRRSPYNVVRGTFKALLTHESLEDIALKRGKRIISLDKAMRLQI